MNENNSKVAIVTGASRGIGAAVAQRLAQEGYAVVVNYASQAAQADALVTRLREQGLSALAVQADVSRPEDARRLFDEAEAHLGTVSVLVNNAGIMKVAPLADTSDELHDQHFAVNVKGSFNTMREAARRLADGGRIINFSTTALALKLPGYATYNATKAAVEAYTATFAKELRGRAITVNAVAPGPVETELFLNGKSAQQVAQMAAMAPLERLGQPEDIAGVVAFLAGPEGGWINGQVLRANGGLA
jgi:3-oxoacyl-[acyl-carrier protein] reductase